VKRLIRGYVELFQGTPLLMQLPNQISSRKALV
jgi:ABC-type amino acid transport system permease subunit